ncbi:MAG: mechanosensitive ion channel family protein [Candidatus Zixiibacteriota bacterium]
MALFVQWWSNLTTSENMINIGYKLLAIAGVIGLSWIVYLIARRILMRAVSHFVEKSKTNWDNILLDNRFFHYMCYFAPAVVIYLAAPLVFEEGTTGLDFMQLFARLYMTFAGLLVFNSFLNGVEDIFRSYEKFKKLPMRSFIQVIKVIAYFIVGIIVISMLIGKSPSFLLGSLGAMTAILLLVFKDSILGFVAGIQLTANKMLQIGDWIEMPSYGADGNVLEVALTTVKVQNFDKTITTIPAYALISSSFKNWRGMQESGGRRIKRAINIDMSTIQFCSKEMVEQFRKIEILKGYIQTKLDEIEKYNKENKIDASILVNGRKMTNIGVFRAYIIEYLKGHPQINREMTFLVRQLAPNENGVPIEIYVFSADQVWANYEAIQADIFDHLMAVIPHFDLRIFQNPTGADFSKIT